MNLHKIPFISRRIPLAPRSVSSSYTEFVSDGNPGNSERCEPRNHSPIGNFVKMHTFKLRKADSMFIRTFGFFHFCRLNRELFLGHVISSAEAGSPRHSRDARAGARGARKAPSTGRISSLRSRATTRGGEGPGRVGSRLDHARNRQGGAKDST